MSKYARKKASISDWARLFRWQNTLFALLCLFVGFRIAFSRVDFLSQLLAYIVLGFSFAGGNALNDALDCEIDKISHKNRPIPSGKISKENALAVARVFLCIGFICAIIAYFFWGITPVVMALCAIILLVFYDVFFKKIMLLGNIIIALLGASVFLLAGAISGFSPAHIYAGAFAFLIQFSREIVKDIEDRAGDEIFKINTLPVKFGDSISARIAVLPLILIVLLSIVPYFTGVFSIWYLGAVILLVDLPLLLVAWSLPISISQKTARRSSLELKIIMALGLLAILIGGVK